MLQDYEIVKKFREGSSISFLVNFIICQVRSENANKKPKDRMRLTSAKAKGIVESAIYRDMISHK